MSSEESKSASFEESALALATEAAIDVQMGENVFDYLSSDSSKKRKTSESTSYSFLPPPRFGAGAGRPPIPASKPPAKGTGKKSEKLNPEDLKVKLLKERKDRRKILFEVERNILDRLDDLSSKERKELLKSLCAREGLMAYPVATSVVAVQSAQQQPKVATKPKEPVISQNPKAKTTGSSIRKDPGVVIAEASRQLFLVNNKDGDFAAEPLRSQCVEHNNAIKAARLAAKATLQKWWLSLPKSENYLRAKLQRVKSRIRKNRLVQMSSDPKLFIPLYRKITETHKNSNKEKSKSVREPRTRLTSAPNPYRRVLRAELGIIREIAYDPRKIESPAAIRSVLDFLKTFQKVFSKVCHTEALGPLKRLMYIKLVGVSDQ